MHSIRIALVCALLLAGAAAAAAGAPAPAASVVRLFVTVQQWDVYQPWDRQYVEEVICSGFFVAEGVLTNAHCVADARMIEVEISGDGGRVTAEVRAVNHQVDLALLALDAGAEPGPAVAFGDLPEPLQAVVTVGYPIGGEEVSYTEGIVSRVSILPYAHSGIPNLLVQTDAAIGPGNSGGPVFSRDTRRCLGVATQDVPEEDGLGYFIPVTVIRQFLRDLEDGVVGGVPNLGIQYQTLENATLRESLGMSRAQSGIRVTRLAAGGSADGLLRRDDVVLSVDGTGIRNDGRVSFPGGAAIALEYLFASRQVGDELTVDVLRAGRPVSIPVRLRAYRSSVVPAVPHYDAPPRYLTLAGLVFVAVEPRYFDLFEEGEAIPPGISVYTERPVGAGGREELVVIARVLAAPINKGYRDAVVNVPVRRVNGATIVSFQTLRDALARPPDGPYIDIELDSGLNIRLRHDEVTGADAEIRERYGVR
jgi:S1-C subfamily serine protease